MAETETNIMLDDLIRLGLDRVKESLGSVEQLIDDAPHIVLSFRIAVLGAILGHTYTGARYRFSEMTPDEFVDKLFTRDAALACAEKAHAALMEHAKSCKNCAAKLHVNDRTITH
jgi:hypothetical protein